MTRAGVIDTHCHLCDPVFDPDREAVLARARGAGVVAVVVVAEDLGSSRRVKELCSGRGDLFATAGIHPHRASTFDRAAADELEGSLREPGIVAVGETGLDYHYDHSPRELQREAFAWQLDASARTGRPVVIHSREADADTARLIGDAPPGVTGVLHSFSGGRELLEAGLERGFCVSFSGMVTFRSWDGTWAVQAVPDDRLLVETDAPFLSPAPHRGRRNEPAFVVRTAARLAELRGTNPERLAELTTANALRLFHLPKSGASQPT